MLQYKQQVMSYIEYRSAATYHATSTVLNRIDKLHDNFLGELGVTREAALMDFNLAPLAMRRDIALLGLLHRSAIGEGPEQFRKFFKRREGSFRLVDPLAASPFMRRSIWGLVSIYNLLDNAVTCSTVSDFQRMLQMRVKRIVAKGLVTDWSTLDSPR